ncbi:hypothetical protein IV500_06465 [Paeniglutamicibacter antarcticus]|uniref:Uncharacterized protein n=1 Tax=Arthrobacter terrae TaxID=2935737 RepID=A0A931CSP1_9MICC|nr:hypothetical protein [Arthrobacter terrae]MBG0739043.1 hypothetical protein [Arthrobacter terrae]
MASPRTRGVLKIAAIALASLLGIAIAAGAVIAGVVESSKPAYSVGQFQTTAPNPPTSLSSKAVPQTDVLERSEATLPSTSQATTEMSVPPESALEPEVAPEVEHTVPPVPIVQVPVAESRPAATATAAPENICPSGTVTSGLTDVTTQNKREWVVGYLFDLVGHGSIHNGTTAAVDVPLYLPYIEGLDTAGHLTMNSFTGDFNYNPPTGTPRPGTLSLLPGQALTYTFAAKDVTSDKMRKTVAWYADPKEAVWNYSDIQNQIDCPEVPVAAQPGGPSIPNIHVAK